MNFDKFKRVVNDTFSNVGQSFYDKYVEANVNFRSKLGMTEQIIRRQFSQCCDWCAQLAGIYEPAYAPAGIYQRHSNCKCQVTHKSSKGYQNVWNNKNRQTLREIRIDHLNEMEQNQADTDKERKDFVKFQKSFNAVSEQKALDILEKERKGWMRWLGYYQIRSIQKYTHNIGEDGKKDYFFQQINQYLRDKAVGSKEYNKTIADSIANISSALRRFHLKENIVCYRSVDDDHYKNIKIGEEFILDAFTSSSVTKRGAFDKKYKVVIFTPSGSRGAYLGDLNYYYPKQEEFLFDYNTFARVIYRQGNTTYIEVMPYVTKKR